MSSLTAPIESGAFPRVPPEIIAAIVSEVLLIVDKSGGIRCSETSDQLKILRLTHRKFADCHHVNKLLFTNIQLEATRDRLLNLQRGDFSRVAGYTRSIRFIAYASWKLVSETWERLILLDTPDHNPDVRSLSHDAMTPLIQSHDAYIHDAKEAQRLLEDPDDELIETWTNVLKIVGSRLENVTLTDDLDHKNLYLQDSDTPKNWKNLRLQVPDTRTEPHEDMRRRLPSDRDGSDNAMYARDYACAIVAERLFNTAMTCLSASGIAVSSLSIQLYMLGNVECKTIPGWQQLDLSNLKKLEITALYPEVPFNLMRKTAMKSSDSPATPCFGGDPEWPTRAAIYDLPALQELVLGTGNNPRLLHDWLLRMKDLRSVGIWGELTDGVPFIQWRHVLDAIRDHPNVSGPDPKGIHFEFPWELSYDGVVCKDSSIATPRKRPKTKSHALEAHLYGEIEFNDNVVLIDQLEDETGAYEQWDSE
ncbi:hypothetical protein FMUND_1811 [Fusarium mundagurra]|uniref:Uncharacterized protein n=1 Tax=Fusarium mundagurra TaxID=1567541 RepID=A0A8H5Z3J7_9HYPO|nr:hypothetical protein FMUND_1811 [Fusarium mundagurra]